MISEKELCGGHFLLSSRGMRVVLFKSHRFVRFEDALTASVEVNYLCSFGVVVLRLLL